MQAAARFPAENKRTLSGQNLCFEAAKETFATHQQACFAEPKLMLRMWHKGSAELKQTFPEPKQRFSTKKDCFQAVNEPFLRGLFKSSKLETNFNLTIV
jgi:hypothetical protein